MKTEQEIKDEIKELQTLKPKVPRKTFFGDDNWEQIDAQIQVLKERMSEDDAFEEFENTDNEDDDHRMVLESARDAVDWMEGSSDQPPSDSWKELVKE